MTALIRSMACGLLESVFQNLPTVPRYQAVLDFENNTVPSRGPPRHLDPYRLTRRLHIA